MPPLPVLVFVVGTGSLGAEIAAVRLLAPYFGASTIVWANTIGVVLVALSIGYWLGGRLADRHPNMRGLCLLALTAAGLLALVPFAANPLLGVAVDALDEISAGRLHRLPVRGARAGGRAGAAARRRLAVRDPAGGVDGRGGRDGGRPPVRDLDCRLAGRHAGVGAAVDPAGRHAPHVPGLRPGDSARRRLGPAAAAPLRARAGGDRRADRPAGGDAQGRGRLRPRDLRGRDAVPVRARGRGARRQPLARAQRGPGAALRTAPPSATPARPARATPTRR